MQQSIKLHLFEKYFFLLCSQMIRVVKSFVLWLFEVIKQLNHLGILPTISGNIYHIASYLRTFGIYSNVVVSSLSVYIRGCKTTGRKWNSSHPRWFFAGSCPGPRSRLPQGFFVRIQVNESLFSPKNSKHDLYFSDVLHCIITFQTK